MKRLPLFIVLLLSIACSEAKFHSGDLVFAAAGGSRFDEAINAATANGGVSFTHVGIVEVAAEGTFVIEAVPHKGVCRTPYNEFVAENGEPTVMRLQCKRDDLQRFIESAKAHLGEPYDDSFMPDNGRIYCSELVYDSYVLPDGRHLFGTHPMNFRAMDGTMPDYWVEHFAELGIPIPENVLGTNPNDMYRECCNYSDLQTVSH